MSDVAVRVERLGKQYRIGRRERYQTLRDTLTDTALAPFRWMRALVSPSALRKAEAPSDLFWALKDVSFDVPRGAVLGIIGRNGAGKSTLLKILSRITEPTEGRIEIRGRVGSLLEVGTGFHPELTGRENIFLNGAILGMRRAEIRRKFDEIVAFAEVDTFVDTAVKHFSSGMYMRLAFAVAAHLEPEILIVDEVLAVGDAQFQKKCLGKMGDVAKEGRTVLFVSHNMVAVNSLCRQALCLFSGRLTNKGDTPGVVAAYLRSDSKDSSHMVWSDPATAPGDAVCRVQQVQILSRRAPASHIPLENPIEICVAYWNFVDGALLNVSLTLYNSEQVCVFSVISPPSERPAGLVRETCEIPGGFLNAGVYRVQAMVVRDTATIRADLPDVVTFEVFETSRSVTWYGHWVGLVRPTLRWRSETLSEAMEPVVAR
jgi:lipopolysaccharide transport system ATP-binding protein